MTDTSPAPISTMPPASSLSPTNNANKANNNNNNNNPISPMFRSSTFAHKTSPAVATQTPLIDTNTPAINAAPVELDGVPTDKETLARKGTGGSGGSGGVGLVSPVDGESEEGEGARAKRQAMLASRSNDPGVIVDLPSLPTAEEVEAAKSAEGTLTPAVLPS